MRKRLTALILMLIIITLCGCYDYVGLDKITIVTGMAIDRDTQTNEFALTYEIISIKESSKEQGLKSKIIDSRGASIFEAFRNAKKRVDHKLYFSNASILIISGKIASEEGLNSVLDVFYRDEEIRDTIKVLISQEERAADIINAEGTTNNILSFDLDFMIEEDAKATSATKSTQLYQLYNQINGEGISPVLPAFRLTENDGKNAAEVNGTALFDKDRLVGYLTPDETKYLLLALNEVKGGHITYISPEDPLKSITLEIAENKTKLSVITEKNSISAGISIKTTGYISENRGYYNEINTQTVDKAQELFSGVITQRLEAVLNKIQKEYNADVIGIGNKIYRKDYYIWNKLKANWKERFKDIKINVSSNIKIENSAYAI